MKNKKSLKFLTVLLFGVLIATGCSCTNSMCTEQDISNIKTQIEVSNIDNWRESYSLDEGGTVYPAEFNTYYTDQGFSGTKSKAEVANDYYIRWTEPTDMFILAQRWPTQSLKNI